MFIEIQSSALCVQMRLISGIKAPPGHSSSEIHSEVHN